jgi:alkylated DNA repair dioxygenase AlkB
MAAEVAGLAPEMTGRCVHLPSVLGPEQASALFECLRHLPWRREVDEFGPQARRTFYCGDLHCDFHFCGLKLRPQEWPQQLAALRPTVEAACGLPPGSLTACLANDYPAGDGFIPFHHDEVRAHGELRAVASLSLGAPRSFRVRRRCGQSMQDGGDGVSAGRSEGVAVAEVELHAGDIFLMTGDCQEYLEHELPLRHADGHRVSLTFRSIVPGFEQARRRAQPQGPAVQPFPPAHVGPPSAAQAEAAKAEDRRRSLGGWRLRAAHAFPWPRSRPVSDEALHGWLHCGNEHLLRRLIADRRPRVIIELGCWLGLTTDFLLQTAGEQAELTVFAVDSWDAPSLLSEQRAQYSQDEKAMDTLNRCAAAPGSLYEAFLFHMWPWRSRVFAVRRKSVEGLRAIHRIGVAPDLIYIDADHSQQAVLDDLKACAELFPGAILVGDDWQWEEVRAAVRGFARAHPEAGTLRFRPKENWWYFEPLAVPEQGAGGAAADAADGIGGAAAALGRLRGGCTDLRQQQQRVVEFVAATPPCE